MTVTNDTIDDVIAFECYFTGLQGAKAGLQADLGRDNEKYGRLYSQEEAFQLAEFNFDHQDTLGTLTICVLVLKNGTTVVGTGACVDPSKYDKEIGRSIARKKAVAQIYPLLGYLHKEQFFQEQQAKIKDQPKESTED